MHLDTRPTVSVRPHIGGGFAVHVGVDPGSKVLASKAILTKLQDEGVATQHVRLLSAVSPFRFSSGDAWANLESFDGDAIIEDGAHLPALVETTGDYLDCGSGALVPKLAFVAGTLILSRRARLDALQLVLGSVAFGDGASAGSLVGIGGDARFRDARTNSIESLRFVGGTILPMHGYMHHWADLSRYNTGMGEVAAIEATRRWQLWKGGVAPLDRSFPIEEQGAAGLTL